uniref:Uncharacterized protein n=1 Tax=Pasteurella multocida TaxID=747 RepID=K4P344_PASMD|nr:hypothetical protein [Pasteurella multocida]AFV53160.1 hypothetical protein pov2012_p8 [Pasteurella multocida]
MKDYQPTNPELLNYAVELLESGKIDGIKCYLADDNALMIDVEMLVNDKPLRIGARVIYPLQDLDKQIAYLEANLLENIKVHFIVESIEIKG